MGSVTRATVRKPPNDINEKRKRKANTSNALTIRHEVEVSKTSHNLSKSHTLTYEELNTLRALGGRETYTDSHNRLASRPRLPRRSFASEAQTLTHGVTWQTHHTSTVGTRAPARGARARAAGSAGRAACGTPQGHLPPRDRPPARRRRRPRGRSRGSGASRRRVRHPRYQRHRPR